MAETKSKFRVGVDIGGTYISELCAATHAANPPATDPRPRHSGWCPRAPSLRHRSEVTPRTGSGPALQDRQEKVPLSCLSYSQSLEPIPRRRPGMNGRVVPPDDIREVLAHAKQAAVDYYRLTGKPLGITGEVGEYEAARLLGLTPRRGPRPGPRRHRRGRLPLPN